MPEIIIQAPGAYTRHTLEPTAPAPPPTPKADKPAPLPWRKQMAVDALVRALMMLPLEARQKPVWLEMPGEARPLESWGSYRGYYECIALDPTHHPLRSAITVEDLIKSLRAAVGTKMHGYKGGEYPIEWSTRLYVSPYGEASGLMVVGVSEVNSYVLIETQSEDA